MTDGARRGRRRGAIGALVIALWLVGIGLLVRREYFRPHTERLAETALRLTPGAVYYAVMQGDRQIGFASSTIDTAETTISVDNYLVADVPVGGREHRASARTHVVLNRAFHTKAFSVNFQADGAPLSARGRVVGDSLLILTVATGTDSKEETHEYRLAGPILLPTLVPAAIALGGDMPKVGKEYRLPVFDPVGMIPREVVVTVRAESSFVLQDSSVFDAAAGRWNGVQPVTLRGWLIATQSETDPTAVAGLSAWIDEQGQVLQTSQLGLDLRRLPYEVAFENWRMASAKAAPNVAAKRDILETTAIGANAKLGASVGELRVRLTGADLTGFELSGHRQEMHGDTLIVRREEASALKARYALPGGGRRLLRSYTRPEPLVQSNDAEIASLASRIAGGARDPRLVAERMNTWVHDSLKKELTFGIPSALDVLRARRGDCNEHTQLYVALARAAGIPARIAAGLAYIHGKFYYHAWPEVYLNAWVAVDPTFGQFPADAAHLRFTVGGLGRQAELLRLMGNLKIDVIGTAGGND